MGLQENLEGALDMIQDLEDEVRSLKDLLGPPAGGSSRGLTGQARCRGEVNKRLPTAEGGG